MNTRFLEGIEILTPQLFLGPYDDPDEFICIEKSPLEHAAIDDHCGIAMAINTKTILPSYVSFVLGTQLMHRGHDASGIGSLDGLISYIEKRQEAIYPGLPNEISFFEKNLPGAIAVYHGRLATWGEVDNPNNTQPFVYENTPYGTLQIAHNGQLVDENNNTQRLKANGVQFTSTSDTEQLGHRIIELGKQGKTLEEAVEITLKEYRVAYSLIITASGPQQVILAKDEKSVRPLYIGTFDGGYIAASETVAINHLKRDGAKIIREVRPGEMVIFDLETLKRGSTFTSKQFAQGSNDGACSFERTYTQRACSCMDGIYNSDFRFNTALQLVRENKPFFDKLKREYKGLLRLVKIPRSGDAGTEGAHEASGIPMRNYVDRADYVLTGEKRVYMGGNSNLRGTIADNKFYYKTEKIRGKFIVTGDDSLVRGDSAMAYNKEIREAGAIGIVNLFFYLMVKHACKYGNPHTNQEELLVHRTGTDLAAIAHELGSDFVRFNSERGYDKVAREMYRHPLCMACGNGKYL